VCTSTPNIYVKGSFVGKLLTGQTDNRPSALLGPLKWSVASVSVANWLSQPDMPLGRRRHSTVIYGPDRPFSSVSAGRRRGTRACHFNANASIVRRARHRKHHEPDRISLQFAFAAQFHLRPVSTAATRLSVWSTWPGAALSAHAAESTAAAAAQRLWLFNWWTPAVYHQSLMYAIGDHVKPSDLFVKYTHTRLECSSGPNCITVPNFVSIGQTVEEIWQFFDCLRS